MTIFLKMDKLHIKYLSPHQLKMTNHNPRIHPDQAIDKLAKGIENYGFINPIIVEKGTDRILAGHARLKASLKQNLKEVPVIEVDLHKDQADGYMVFDNAIQDKTEWDYPILKDILEELDTGAFDMELTGFDEMEIENLMTVFDAEYNPSNEWVNMPEFEQEDKTAYQSIHIHFANQNDVDKFAKLIKQNITDKTRSLWFPEIIIERYADKEYK